MPSWCQIDLTISGDDVELKRFREKHFTDDLLNLNTIIPLPADIPRDSMEAYEWRCDNWGTKWNPTITSDQMPERGVLSLHLRSAWGPPIPCLNRLVEMYPNLRFDGSCCYEMERYEHLYTLQEEGMRPARLN
jgi:hypothetical protein